MSARSPYTAPLNGGLVVEASAGTGKTYTLTTLVARLVVEAHHRIDDLLIVTFTVAATGELRTRVWETLCAARDAAAGRTAATSQARELAGHWRKAGLLDAAEARLTRAIRDFDRANITTIHGFCQRALGEFALEAGLPFRFGVSGDGALEVESAARDFWRKEMAGEPVPLLEYARARKFLLDQSADWSGQALARSSVLRPAMSATEFARLWAKRRDAWHDAFKAARADWIAPRQPVALREFWESDAYTWRKSKTYFKDQAAFEALTAAFDANEPDLLSLGTAGYFGRESLTAQLYKNTPPPDTPPFDRLDQLAYAASQLGEFWLLGRRRGLLTEAAATLHDGVWRNRQLTFDALLSELHDALYGENANALAARMRARYPIALIDEFQDTDRLQARVFEAVYPRDGLIVVGDPKQSIFRFRGADVYAYVDAKRRLDGGQLQLTQNYRSTPRLVEAVNAVFQHDDALVLEEVGFEPAIAAGGAGELRVEDPDFDHRPFQLHVFGSSEDGKPWTKPALTDHAATHAANRVAALIGMGAAGKAVLARGQTTRPLAAADVAVLVRTGEQGRAMIRELRARGLRTVEIGTESVFDSDEAATLHRLLQALATDEAEFDAAARLRGALAAEMFDLDMADLDRLREDDRIWARWLDRARDWRRLWASGGIASLMRHLLFADDPACAGNLLAHPNGPRRLTNFLHLTDLLHDAETRHRLSRRGLLDWFAHFKAQPKRGGETAQLRLESDEDLVKVVTIHRAKGLEFPIVFCPFAWWGRKPDKNATAQYYDSESNEPVLDLQPSLKALEREQQEEFADEVRLSYVALTRAKYRCEVTWGSANDSEHAPLDWLLPADIDDFARRAPEAISVLDATVADEATTVPRPDLGNETLRARELNRPLGGTRQLTSYSALTAGMSAAHDEAVDEPDHDADEPLAETPAEPALDVFGFPAGSRAGNCLHEILERHVEHGDMEATCRDALARYGIDAKWLPVAQSMVSNAWDAPLGTIEPTFRLADVERPVAEMEFHLPVRGFRRDRLADILAEHGYDSRIPEDVQTINGFLHGFIDLVAQHDGRWYVLDYKSNWLGGNVVAYDPASIQRSMRHHGYHLQYLLYLTALDRLLRVRLRGYDYDRHIGGACYLFLRGMHPDAPGRGVHFDRPGRECITAIDGCLSGGRDD
ncbi:MAG: exodeoxyribonuclease V subunit beta [Gammaproteobacteria bacterium]|nr:exodeoxyribonuclease V subunit beta [Gammaproteobacteria bacterium]